MCLIQLSYAIGSCDSFESRCSIEIGSPLLLNNSLLLTIKPAGAIYFYFSVPADAKELNIEASVLFGTIDIFLTKDGRIPTKSDSDVSTLGRNVQDFLSLVNKSHLTKYKFNNIFLFHHKYL